METGQETGRRVSDLGLDGPGHGEDLQQGGDGGENTRVAFPPDKVDGGLQYKLNHCRGFRTKAIKRD